MVPASAYPVSPAWRLLMHAFGVAPADVLRRAGLPEDLLARDNATLHQYLVQSRTAWSGELEFPQETDPDRERRNDPTSNSGTQTPLQRSTDTPRDNPRR